ncbi:hypothetical protein YPPY08_4375, partial [Yersinia pestis PY-08]
MRERRAQSPG